MCASSESQLEGGYISKTCVRVPIICPAPSRFSSGGTRSVLHTDAHDNLHCLVSGVKEFVMMDPQYTETIGPEHTAQGFYNIDVDQ